MGRRTDIQFRGYRLLRNVLANTSDFKNARVGLHARLSVAWANAAEAFIKAAMQTIKVQTGMSASSYIALARAIRRQGAEPAINAAIAERGKAPFNRPGIPTFPQGQRRSGTQGKRAGRQLGARAYTFLTGSPSKFGFIFNFQTVVYQHAFHEFSAHTMENGFTAFRDSILEELPDIGLSTLQDWYSNRKTVNRRSISSTPTRIRFV